MYSQETFGGLLPTLELIGVAPAAITDVIFSHTHGDHLGGTSSDGQLDFPNAQHYLPQLEWEDLHREDIPEFAGPFIEFARHQLQPHLDTDGQLAFTAMRMNWFREFRPLPHPGILPTTTL